MSSYETVFLIYCSSVTLTIITGANKIEVNFNLFIQYLHINLSLSVSHTLKHYIAASYLGHFNGLQGVKVIKIFGSVFMVAVMV